MNLEDKVMASLKDAMKAKNEVQLRSLRAIKSAILLAKTSAGAKAELGEKEEMDILMKMAKQRRDSLAIFREQDREDLAAKEEEELAVINSFLPEQMGESELREKIEAIIERVGAASPADLGKVMGAATKELAGRADGKSISTMARNLLSQS